MGPCNCVLLISYSHRIELKLTEMITLTDRFSVNSQSQYLHSKYIGTGNAEFTKFDWLLQIHRDSLVSYIGHHTLASYFALAQNDSIGRAKFRFMQNMIVPCGIRPH